MSYSLPYSFIPGTKARAQELNANFSSVVQTIDDFDAQKADIDLSNLSQSGIEVLKNNSVSRNVGEVVMSAFPLNDSGLHLLDGSVLNGSGIYRDFVDYIKNLYNENSTFNREAFSVSGSPTLTSDGIVSEITSGDSISITLPQYGNDFVLKTKFKTPNTIDATSSNMEFIARNNNFAIYFRGYNDTYYIPAIRISDGSNSYAIRSYLNNWTASADTEYEIEVGYNSVTKYIYMKMWETNTNTLVQDVSATPTSYNVDLSSFNNINTMLGIGSQSTEHWKGAIDLKSLLMVSDGVPVFSGCNTTNSFTDETSWQNCVSSYGECAKFVYDSTNNTVRLPKISGIIEGTFNALAVGNLTEAGLPDISGYLTDMNSNPEITSCGAFSHEYTNSFNMTAGSGNHYIETIRFSAHSANPLYGSSSTVQPQTVKYLVYIVVATTPKTDIQIDINNIATDLNNKVDTDLTNCTKPYITETYKNGSSWYRIYSDGWCEQGGIVSVAQNSTGTTVTLLKSYLDTNYTRLVCLNNFAASWNAELCPRIVANSTSQIGIQSGATTNPSLMSWYTCGKIR